MRDALAFVKKYLVDSLDKYIFSQSPYNIFLYSYICKKKLLYNSEIRMFKQLPHASYENMSLNLFV